jgi:ABC-type multidrug transport system ATPase subunit/two-component sensor histidine kinase
MAYQSEEKNRALLRLSRIALNYGQVRALKGINLSIGPSEVHAIVGEHGAGKSSLGMITSGMLKPKSGFISFNSKQYDYLTLKMAIDLGIGMVCQQVQLYEHFTVAENLFFSAKTTSKLFWRSKKRRLKEAKELLLRYNFDIDPSIPLKSLNLSDRTLVDILKNIHTRPKLLILDEALERLSTEDLKKILEILFDMKKKGMSIIFITHRIDDIYNVADRVSIIKNGEILITDYVRNIDKINLIKMAYTQISMEHIYTNPNKEFYQLLKYNEAILRNLPVNLIVTDSDNKIKLVNDYCKRYFHLENTSYINEPLNRLFAWNNDEIVNLILDAFSSKNEKTFYQVPIVLNNIHTINNIKTFPIYDGTICIGNIIIIEDISEYDQLQKQFILSEKLASVGLLAAGVAHEINNPLEIILNHLSYMKYEFPHQGIQEGIGNIREEIFSIANIVSNLHSFSDNKRIVIEEIEINDLIGKMLTLIKHNARHKRISLSFIPDDMDIRVYVNKNEIKQVILNLLKNSFEAMPEGGRISIKTETIKKKDSIFAQVILADSGPGLEIENPDDIFLPFYSTKNNQEKNLGLGLSVSYGILKKYDGSISVNSSYESGCQFTITIPQCM